MPVGFRKRLSLRFTLLLVPISGFYLPQAIWSVIGLGFRFGDLMVLRSFDCSFGCSFIRLCQIIASDLVISSACPHCGHDVESSLHCL